MSQFAEYGETARLYTIVDSNSTKKAEYNLSGSYATLSDVVVIRLTPVEASLLGDPNIEAVSQLDTTETLKEGQIIYLETSHLGYKIKNKPRYNRLFKSYKVELREVEVTIP